jgi:hypothetical protein
MNRAQIEVLDPEFCNMQFGASWRHWLHLRFAARRHAIG